MPANRPRCFATEAVDQILFVVPNEFVGRLTGMDLANERSAFVQQMRDAKAKGVIFDLGAVNAFGSQLIGTLVFAWKEARGLGATMVLCNLSDIGRQVLERSKLFSLWSIYASRDQAVASFPAANAPRAAIVSDTARLRELEEKARDEKATDEKAPDRLQIIETGLRTVLGFGTADLPPEHALGRYLTALTKLIEREGCVELVFDLGGVSAVPSGFLGVMASILKQGVAVSVKHASQEVREVLALTNFDRLVKVE
jgi:anti-anti-sigma regulatory factor